MKQQQIIRKEVTFQMEVKQADLLDLLRNAGYPVPADARMTVHVPGGGDWSHTDLDIGEHPVQIVWKTTEVSE